MGQPSQDFEPNRNASRRLMSGLLSVIAEKQPDAPLVFEDVLPFAKDFFGYRMVESEKAASGKQRSDHLAELAELSELWLCWTD